MTPDVAGVRAARAALEACLRWHDDETASDHSWSQARAALAGLDVGTVEGLVGALELGQTAMSVYHHTPECKFTGCTCGNAATYRDAHQAFQRAARTALARARGEAKP